MGGRGELGSEWPLACCPSVVTRPPGVEKGGRCGGCTYAPGEGSVIEGPLVGTQLVGLWSCTPGCGVMGRDGVIGGPVGK